MKVCIMGDFCPSVNIDDNSFNDITNLLSTFDYRIVNLECALRQGEELPIAKEGPFLGCNLSQFHHLKSIKADMITLANNHVLDYGEKGLENIFLESQKIGIRTVGAGLDNHSKTRIAYINDGDKKIAIINCCEAEFSVTDEKNAGANPLDEIDIYNKIQEAKNEAYSVIVIVHGGHEYFQLPSLRIQKIFRFFIDVGADVVVGHHPHCYSGYEQYKEGYIFYSLGNFFFDNNSSNHTIWNDGFFVELDISFGVQKEIGYAVYPYIQCCGNNKVLLMRDTEKQAFYEQIIKLNRIIEDKKLLQKEFYKYADKQKRHALSRILPYSNHYLQALFKRGFLPSFLSKKAIVSHLNAIRCEAHKDLLIYALYKKYKGEQI